jgi:CelD/BcsL family acetyltransferase involved in cellulose biosynthesis
LRKLLELTNAIGGKNRRAGLARDIIGLHRRDQYLQWTAKTGRMRGYVLSIAGRPVAAWIGSRFGNTFYLDVCEQEPAFKKYRPGHFLAMRIKEDLIGNTDIRLVDFQAAPPEYRNCHGNRSLRERDMTLYAQTGRGLALNFLDTTGAIFSSAAGNASKLAASAAGLLRTRSALPHEIEHGGEAPAPSAVDRETGIGTGKP